MPDDPEVPDDPDVPEDPEVPEEPDVPEGPTSLADKSTAAGLFKSIFTIPALDDVVTLTSPIALSYKCVTSGVTFNLNSKKV